MSEGSSRPLSASGAKVSAPPPEIDLEGRLADSRGRLPDFSAEHAERGIQAFSRFAGPAAFFLALGGIVWWIVN